jgi:hypothetical protein
VYDPKSINHDYQDFDKHYLKEIKATSVARLKKNLIMGQQTHWTFHNRHHDVFSNKGIEVRTSRVTSQSYLNKSIDSHTCRFEILFYRQSNFRF